MTHDEIRQTILAELGRIAPEFDQARLESRANLRDQVDLDSMDFLNFLIALHQRLGIEIPEGDYSHFYTLDAAVTYVASKLRLEAAR